MFKQSKKIFALLAFVSIFLTIFFIASCSETPINPNEGASNQLSKVASSAKLYIYNNYKNNQTIDISAVQSSWTECGVTWNSMVTTYSPESSFSTNATGWLEIDVKNIVNKWLDGTYANNGILLTTSGTLLEEFSSKEGANPPYIHIVYSDGSMEDILDIADTELNEQIPSGNFCGATRLFCALYNGFNKYPILKFDIQPQIDCGECEGKVSQLTLQYNGNSSALVKVVQKKNNVIVFPETSLNPGDQFTFNGTDNGTLGTEIIIYVDGAEHVRIHTSCSQPIGPGLIKGDFKVIDGYSKNGGRLCPLPPQPDCGECDGKVTQLTLQYNGISDAQIKVVQKKNNVVVFDDTVAAGGQFTFNGTDKGTLGTEITLYVDGVQNTKIHTSCSQPIGPGLIKGDFEVIEGYSKKGGKLCPLPPLPPAGWCDGTKPKALGVKYTGEDCGASNHNQDPSKVSCSGDPLFADSVMIKVTDKSNPADPTAKVWFNGQVAIGDLFYIDAANAGASKLKADTYVFVYDLAGNLLQTIKFHTSCSQPLAAGDQFGSILMVEFVPEN